MSIERLFLLDPYNDMHLHMIKTFESNNELPEKISEEIKKIRESLSKEEYLSSKRANNEVQEILFIEKDSKITDCCHIQEEKDIKACKIIPLTIKNKEKKRRLPSLAADYALNTLGIEEVFIDIDENDKTMQDYLKLKGFEDLGLENGKLIYLKEREEKETIQRKIA